MPVLFRLRFALILSAVLVLYGWAGQRDYEDQRTAECASRKTPLGYDPITDTCTIAIPSSRASGASSASTAKAH